MLKPLIRTANRPHGFWGSLMILKMNLLHTPLSHWGLSFFRVAKEAHILEIGCGGGRNLRRLARLAPKGHVIGVDYASLSVRRANLANLFNLLRGKVAVMEASVEALPFREGLFDAACAFETIYYWPHLVDNFKEVRRVLKPTGQFLIVNEDRLDPEKPDAFDAIKALLPIRYDTDDTIVAALKEAGFEQIEVHNHANGQWLAIVARNES